MKTYSSGLISILLLLVISSCAKEAEDSFLTPKERVSVIIAKKEIVVPEYHSFGTVIYFNKADVLPTTEGIVEKIFAEEGMIIEENQILAGLRKKKLLLQKEQAEAELRSKEALLSLAEEKVREGKKSFEARLIKINNAEAELEQRKNEYLNISSTYENKKKLYEVGGITREELEAVKTQYLSYKTKLIQSEGDLEIQKIGFRDEDLIKAGYYVPQDKKKKYELFLIINTRLLEAERKVAEAEYYAALSRIKTLDLLIEETDIHAPISGIVSSRYLDIGEKATPETKLFTLFNIDRVYIQIEVSENDLERIKLGQKTYIFADQENLPELAGNVKLISPYISPETRTCRIKIEADNRNHRLIPGSFVRVRIITGEKQNMITLPEDSVLQEEKGSSYVFMIRENILFKKEVATGFKHQAKITITGGIDEGEMICAKPSSTFREGMEVEVRP